jgi:hypothetical protein
LCFNPFQTYVVLPCRGIDCFSYDNRGAKFRQLSNLALKEAHKQQQEEARSKAK